MSSGHRPLTSSYWVRQALVDEGVAGKGRKPCLYESALPGFAQPSLLRRLFHMATSCGGNAGCLPRLRLVFCSELYIASRDMLSEIWYNLLRKAPVLHNSPMNDFNVLLDNVFSEMWESLGDSIDKDEMNRASFSEENGGPVQCPVHYST